MPSLSVNFFGVVQLKRITIDLYPSGDLDKTNPVVLSFNGRLYDDLLLPETAEISKLSDDEKFLAKVIAANSKGTLDDVLLQIPTSGKTSGRWHRIQSSSKQTEDYLAP